VDRKGIEAWEGVLSTRVWVLSNGPPKFTDATGVIVDRFIPIQYRRSFADRPDTGLTPKLLAELPGILNRLIVALARLRARGYSRIPESGKSLLEAMARAMLPEKEKRVFVRGASGAPRRSLAPGAKAPGVARVVSRATRRAITVAEGPRVRILRHVRELS
jgi:hypothetical protein